jgi:hypothetical protein
MTREPGKMVKVFIALISLAALAIALTGGILVSHQQVVEERSGLWKQVMPLTDDDTIPVFSNLMVPHQGYPSGLFSSPPPG